MPKSQSKELRMMTYRNNERVVPCTAACNRWPGLSLSLQIWHAQKLKKNSTYGSRNGLFLKFSHSELRVYGSYSLSSSVLLSVSQPLIMSPKACLLGVHASKIDIFGSKFFSLEILLYPYFSHNNSKTKDRTRKSLWSEVGARLGFHMRHMRLVLSQFPVRQIEFRVPPLFALTPWNHKLFHGSWAFQGPQAPYVYSRVAYASTI